MSSLFTTGPGRLLLPRSRAPQVRYPDPRGLVTPQPASVGSIDYDTLIVERQWQEYEAGDADAVRYFCYELSQTPPGGGEVDHYYKAVRMLRLTRVPRYLRASGGSSGTHVFSQMRDLLVGLREKGILFCNLIAKTPQIPLVFAYGVQGLGNTIEEARELADEAYAALTVNLDGTYQQLEYAPITAYEGQLLSRYQGEWNHIAVARGRPMPQGAPLGSSAAFDGNRTDVENTNNQLESFIRGMIDRSFMMTLITTPLTMDDMALGWSNVARHLSAVRSDTDGTRGFSAGVALPLGLGTSHGDTSGSSHGLTGTDTHGVSDSTGVSTSHALGTSATDTSSVSHSATDTVGTNTSDSVTDTHGLSHGISHSVTDTAGTSSTVTDGSNNTHTDSTNATGTHGTNNTHTGGTSSTQTDGANDTRTLGTSTTATDGTSNTHTDGANDTNTVGTSATHTDGTSATVTDGTNNTHTDGTSATVTDGTNNTHTDGTSATVTDGTSATHTDGTNATRTVGTSTTDTAGLSHTVGTNQSTGLSHTDTTGQSVGTSHGVSASQSLGSSATGTSSYSHGISDTSTAGQSSSSGWNSGVTDGTSSGTSFGTSTSQGTNYGSSVSDGSSMSGGIPGLSGGQNTSQGYSSGTNSGLGANYGVSAGVSQAATHGLSGSNASSYSQALGISDSYGTSMAHGVSATNSVGTNDSINQGYSTSASDGTTYTTGSSQSDASSYSHAVGASQSLAQGVSASDAYGTSHSLAQGVSASDAYGTSTSAAHGVSASDAAGVSRSVAQGSSASAAAGNSTSQAAGISTSQAAGTSASQAAGVGASNAAGTSASVASGVSASQSVGTSNTDTASVSQAAGHTTGTSASTATGTSSGVSSATGRSDTNTEGANASTGTSTSQAVAESTQVALSRQLSQTGTLGIVPTLSATKTMQTRDERKRMVGDLLQSKADRYMDGIEGGGYLYQLFLTTPDRDTMVAGAAMMKSAFWGPGSRTHRLDAPFHTHIVTDVAEAARLRVHAGAFAAYLRREPTPGIIEPYLYSSFATTGEISTLCHPPTAEAPGLQTQVDSMPVLAMPADRNDRQLTLGRIVNGERGRISELRFGLDTDELTHTLIQGVTGMGKTTTMMALLCELAAAKRTVVDYADPTDPATATSRELPASALVIDWMRNGRRLAGILPAERFALYSVTNPRLGRFRFNPLAIPDPAMDPTEWLGAVADQLSASFGLGDFGRNLISEQVDVLFSANRLAGFTLLEALVDPDTDQVLRPALMLPPVDPADLPAGAVATDASGAAYANVYTCPELSRLVGMPELATLVAARVERAATVEGARLEGQAMRDRLQSLWRRLQNFAPGGPLAATMAADPNWATRECLTVTDLVNPISGQFTVLETDGLSMEGRRVLIGSMMLAIYRYALFHPNRPFDVGGRGPGTYIFLEEAHELFGAADGAESRSDAGHRAQLYESMFRRGRQTGLKLIALTQNCAQIPPGVVSQTTTMIAHATTDEADKKTIMAQLNWVNMIGQQQREYRYLGEMPVGWAIVRLKPVHSYLEAQPVQIVVDDPGLPDVDDSVLAALAATRAAARAAGLGA